MGLMNTLQIMVTVEDGQELKPLGISLIKGIKPEISGKVVKKKMSRSVQMAGSKRGKYNLTGKNNTGKNGERKRKRDPEEEIDKGDAPPGMNCIKTGLPRKLIFSKRKGHREVLFS